MSAHDDETDTISDSLDDTESCSSLPGDIVFKGTRLCRLRSGIPQSSGASNPDDTVVALSKTDAECSSSTVVECNPLDKESFHDTVLTPIQQVFGSVLSDYGYGSVRNTKSKVLQETVEAGDDAFNKGQFKEALQEYDKAIHMEPRNVNWKIVRADTLVRLSRFTEAFSEFREAYMLDPDNGRLHHRMSLFHLRLGVIDMAELHMTKASLEYRKELHAKIAKVKDHLIRGGKARKDNNWIAALKEVDAMIAAGADSSQPILVFRAEMLLKLGKVDQAEETIKRTAVLERKLSYSFKFLGMPPEAYLCAVDAQIELAVGRFERAVAAVDRAHRIDQFNDEISSIHRHVQITCMAGIRGNKHYRSGDYFKAWKEYRVALKYAKSNIALLDYLAASHVQLETWENVVEICNQVLQIRPYSSNALARRAYSYAMLEKWDEAVKDYEGAIRKFPGNMYFTMGLKELRAELKKSQLTEFTETLVEAQGAVKESQVAKHAETLVEAQGTVVKESQVTELAETPVEAQAAVKESQVEDVSED